MSEVISPFEAGVLIDWKIGGSFLILVPNMRGLQVRHFERAYVHMVVEKVHSLSILAKLLN